MKRAAPPNDDAFWAQVPVVDRTLAKLDAAINEVEATGRDSVRNPGDARYAAAADRATAAADRQRKQCTEEVQRLKRMVSRNTHDRAITVLERYEETLGRQRKIESQINREVKDRAARQYRIVKPDATEREIEQVIRNPDQVFSQALKGSHRYNQVRRAADEVNKRHQDILKIERTLEELAQMFTEMATLVLKQDDQIVEISEVAVTVEKDIVQG